MSNEEMRIAVAKLMGFCGCEDVNCDYRKCQHLHKDGRAYFPESYSVPMYPNYPQDLNACHEMEKTLTDEQMKNYTYKLFFHCAGANDEREFFICHATAAQRCEAFLRATNLWRE